MYETDYKREYEALKQQMEWDKYERDRASQEAYEQREKQRNERQREWKEQQHYAESWNEAFRKSIALFSKEASEEQRNNADEEFVKQFSRETWFSDQLAQIESAKKHYTEQQKEASERIRRIKQRAQQLIDAVEQRTLNVVADKIEAEFTDSSLVCEALRDNDWTSLIDW